MKKYKRNKINLKFIILIVVIILCTTFSVGYSIWSKDLFINGTANIKVEDREIDIGESIPTNPDGTHTNIMDGWNAVDGLEFKGEVLDKNVLKLIFQVKPKTPNKSQIIDLNFNINNVFDYEMQNGKIELNITGDANAIQNSENYNLTTPIPINGTGKFESSFSIRNKNVVTRVLLDYKITYEVNGTPQVMYFQVEILPN